MGELQCVSLVVSLLCICNHKNCRKMTQRNIPAPRVCHIVKSEDYQGFGFNLYQEKSKPGQFIGRIEPGSPAERAGLLEDDKIVEVNGVNVAKENHKEVVARIKEKSKETTLLVVDKICEDYHKEQRKVIHSNLPYVEYISSEVIESDHDEEYINTDLQVMKTVEQEPEIENIEETENVQDKIQAVTRTDSGIEEEYAQHRADTNHCAEEGLDLNMSAKEMREKLHRKRRIDPRKEEGKRGSGDWWMQYKMIQTL